MRLLLTSGGIRNDSMKTALAQFVGQPFRTTKTGGQPISPFNLFDWYVQPHVDFDTWDPAPAARLDCPVYAIDDETALRVVDGHVKVVSEGSWKLVDGS